MIQIDETVLLAYVEKHKLDMDILCTLIRLSVARAKANQVVNDRRPINSRYLPMLTEPTV